MPDQIIANTDEKSPLEAIGETLANSLNKQGSPFQEPKNEMFVAEPFFKEETIEATAEAGTVVETKETKLETQELNEDGTPKTPVTEVTQTTTTQAAPQKEDMPEEEFIGLLNTAINDPEVAFGSINDIKAVIEENKKFKQAGNELQGLSQEERARIEVGRESGDFGLYDRVMAIDTAKISHKEALRHAYFLDNIGKSTQFLEETFKRNFISTYENEADEDYSKMLLEENGQEAISRIIDLQEDLKKRGQISGSANPEDTKKAKEAEDNKWFADVDKVLEKNDRVTYTFEDGLAINIVMDAKDKAIIQEAMDKPLPFFRSLITEENGQISHDSLFEFVMFMNYKEEILNEARKSGAAFREEKILKEKKNAVIDPGRAGDPGTETKPIDQIAKNFQQLIHNNY